MAFLSFDLRKIQHRPGQGQPTGPTVTAGKSCCNPIVFRQQAGISPQGRMPASAAAPRVGRVIMHSIYDWFRRHRFAVDFVLMAVLWLMVVPFSLSTMTPGLDSTASTVAALFFSTALVVPLAWRRTRTVTAGFIIAAVAILQWALNVLPMPAEIAVPLVVYALAAFGPRWASLGGLALALLGAIMMVTRYFYDLTTLSLGDIPQGIALVLMVWVLVLFSWTAGDLTRTKRLRGQALEDRAHRLEIEAQHERDLAASDERAHIAREMHDIVAHSLSVIITQADGARYAAVANPEIAPETLATIAATGRSSLQEMRRLLGVLRGDGEASTRPLPGLGDLDELLLGIRAAGLPVAFAVTGEARRQLPPGAELTAYRAVQEGLTNVMKHAGPNVQAAVHLTWNARGLEVAVRDDGRGATVGLSTQAPSHTPLTNTAPSSPAHSHPAPSTADRPTVPLSPARAPQPVSAGTPGSIAPGPPAPPGSPPGGPPGSNPSTPSLGIPSTPSTASRGAGGRIDVVPSHGNRHTAAASPKGKAADAATAHSAGAGGNGLRGMAERVKLYDGTLAAGPLVGGGFGVTAFIPYTEN